MKAMRLHAPGGPLSCDELPLPDPGPGELLLQVAACGVCRTDLHVVDGELPGIRYPLTPGHEIVGRVVSAGAAAQFAVGERVGVPWLGGTCGRCRWCRQGRENLCERGQFTGYTRAGGYAQYVVANAGYCFAIPDRYDDAEAAPLLCAGLIGYRALRAAGEARTLGLYGFGASAHLLAQLATAQGSRVVAFTRPGDAEAQQFAISVGAIWAGGSDELPPEPLDAAILFAPVCAGIHMSDIPSFPYRLLWEERSIASVANLTRKDGEEFMRLAGEIPLQVSVERAPLAQANEALARLRGGELQGAAVLVNEPAGNSTNAG